VENRRSPVAGTLFAELLAKDGVESLPASALKILEGTLRVLGGRGLSDLSIESICKVSRVSRATLYRYFSTKDDLLEAVGEFICRGFEDGITAEAARHDDPTARFAAVMCFLARYTAERGLIRIFEADPSFHLVFFRSHFARQETAVRAALDPVFDMLEARDGLAVDRSASAQRLIRLQMSRLLIPFDDGWSAAWDRAVVDAGKVMHHWIVAQPATLDNMKKLESADGDRDRSRD
jgi:AcrR family transcriptional regulator